MSRVRAPDRAVKITVFADKRSCGDGDFFCPKACIETIDLIVKKGEIMLIIACVDERNGMMFNYRRQSRDSVVYQDVLRECYGKRLYMNAYSGNLFAESEGVDIRISEDILSRAGDEDACFIEDIELAGFEDQIRQVILYKWNRKYPADRYFTLNLSDGSWECQKTEEFKGSSHERITKEVYQRIR